MMFDSSGLSRLHRGSGPFLRIHNGGYLAAGSILIYLMVKSSDEFTVEETEKNSDDFAGVIRDSHGPVTTWLWVA